MSCQRLMPRVGGADMGDRLIRDELQATVGFLLSRVSGLGT